MRSEVLRKLAIFVLVTACLGLGKDPPKPADPNSGRQFRTLIPLGAERIALRPSKRSLYLLATAESPYFEGWHGRDNSHDLFDSEGAKVRAFPQQLGFRVTATAMRPDLLMIDSYGTLSISDTAINDFLLNLKFRVLIFHGLEITAVEPESVRLLGMPSDINYEERIFHLSFNLPRQVPIEDRIILEVNSPTGYRMCKFHLDF